MSQEAKILLTIQLEGVLSNKTEGVVLLPYVRHDAEGKKVIATGYFKHLVKKNTDCVKKVRLSQDNYNYFTDPNDVPGWYVAKKHGNRGWHQLSVNERIIAHCERIAEGKSFTFEIIH